MQSSVVFEHGVTHLLVSVPTLLEQMHGVLSSSGRLVLTIAATLFLAYVILMTTALVASLVRGWVQTALERNGRTAIAPRSRAIHATLEQS